MLFNQMTFIGIDPTAGQKPFCYAALDHELRPIALGAGRLDEILAFSAGQRQAVIAVCSPRRPNQGVMTRQEVRQQLNPLPASGRWVDFRLADYLLRQRNIVIPQTPSDLSVCPKWMQMGFSLYTHLEKLGYRTYPIDGAELQTLEVYPHASFTVLMKKIPFPKYTLEGRLQRQLVLYENNIRLPDPMRFFEEITSHKLLKGILPTENLYSAGELDALVAAYTAWLAVTRPKDVLLLGDAQEGQIVLPTGELEFHYT